jgi:hypothetical protein
LKHAATIGDFCENNDASDRRGSFLIVRPPVLLPSQKHITMNRPLNARQETSILCHEGDCDLMLPAQAQQKGSTSDVAEANNAAQNVDWDPKFLLVVDADSNCLTILLQIRTVSCDVQSVQQTYHFSSFLSEEGDNPNSERIAAM